MLTENEVIVVAGVTRLLKLELTLCDEYIVALSVLHISAVSHMFWPAISTTLKVLPLMLAKCVFVVAQSVVPS